MVAEAAEVVQQPIQDQLRRPSEPENEKDIPLQAQAVVVEAAAAAAGVVVVPPLLQPLAPPTSR